MLKVNSGDTVTQIPIEPADEVAALQADPLLDTSIPEVRKQIFEYRQLCERNAVEPEQIPQTIRSVIEIHQQITTVDHRLPPTVLSDNRVLLTQLPETNFFQALAYPEHIQGLRQELDSFIEFVHKHKMHPVEKFHTILKQGKRLCAEYIECQQAKASGATLLPESLHFDNIFDLTRYLSSIGFPIAQLKRNPMRVFFFDTALQYVQNSCRVRTEIDGMLRKKLPQPKDFFDKTMPQLHAAMTGTNNGKAIYKGTTFWEEKDLVPGKYFTRQNPQEERILPPEADIIRATIKEGLSVVPPSHPLHRHKERISTGDHHTYGPLSIETELTWEEIQNAALIPKNYEAYDETQAQVGITRARNYLEQALQPDNEPTETMDGLALFIQEFTHLGAFYNVNYSLTMSVVNSVLQKQLGVVTLQGYLDFLSFDTSNEVFKHLFRYHITNFSFDPYNPFEVWIASARFEQLTYSRNNEEVDKLKEYFGRL